MVTLFGILTSQVVGSDVSTSLWTVSIRLLDCPGGADCCLLGFFSGGDLLFMCLLIIVYLVSLYLLDRSLIRSMIYKCSLPLCELCYPLRIAQKFYILMRTVNQFPGFCFFGKGFCSRKIALLHLRPWRDPVCCQNVLVLTLHPSSLHPFSLLWALVDPLSCDWLLLSSLSMMLAPQWNLVGF